MRKTSSTRLQGKAFTLIELLVVISIIALLIGILLPVLGKARDASRTHVCARFVINPQPGGTGMPNFMSRSNKQLNTSADQHFF